MSDFMAKMHQSRWNKGDLHLREEEEYREKKGRGREKQGKVREKRVEGPHVYLYIFLRRAHNNRLIGLVMTLTFDLYNLSSSSPKCSKYSRKKL